MAKKKRRQTPAQAKLDIVIPVYGRLDLLENCLAHLPAALDGIEAKIYIVDDAGPDGDKIAGKLGGANVKIKRNPANVGFAATVNIGARLGRAPLILILNTDVDMQPASIRLMVEEIESDPKIGVVGPKLLFPADSTDPTRPAGKVQHAGMMVTIRGGITHSNLGWSEGHPKVNERRTLQAVTGACMLTTRKVWNEVLTLYRKNGDPTSGAMNEVYGKGTYEDIEYCFAVRTLGYTVIYIPTATGYHHVGASVTNSDSPYPMERNELVFRARCGTMLAWDEWRFY